MDINPANLDILFRAFNAKFNQGWTRAESFYKKIAMITQSSTREETYGWLGQFPQMREWIGDRVLNNLSTSSYTIVNKDFEQTITVPRNDVKDDRFGIFGPMFDEMGRDAAEQPDKLVAKLINDGFASLCYDGQYFFDIDHPVLDVIGNPYSVSNFDAGAYPAWYLLDGSRALSSFIYQEREDYKMVSRDDPKTSDHVFMRKEFVYGVDGRSNAGYGLWQLVHASKLDLTPANYAAARKAMRTMRGDFARPLGIKPTILLVPAELEEQGMRLINNMLAANGESNPWMNSVELVVTPWLSA